MTFSRLLLLITLTSLCGGQVQSGEIIQTLSLNHKFKPGETIVWSPAFQKCWDETCRFYKIESLDLKPETPLVAELNSFTYDYKATVPFKSHLSIVTGLGEEFRKQANNLIIRHFGRDEPLLEEADFATDNPDDLRVLDVMLISILRHKLAFEANFEPSKQPLLFKEDKDQHIKAKCFGIWGKNRSQLPGLGRVLAYSVDKQTLGLAFPGKDPDEEVVLMQNPAITTPLQAVETLENWTAAFNKAPKDAKRVTGRLDTIIIPQLSLESHADFKAQLPGKMDMGNGSFISIAAARQRATLKLDEKGATTITKAFIVAPTYITAGGEGWTGGTPGDAKPEERWFVFDQPFIFMVRKKDAKYPFIMAHIGGPGLVPEKKP